MPLLVIPLAVVLLIVILVPISVVQRFRRGTRRQQARGWLATLNMIGLLLSVLLVCTGALITSQWVPEALPYTLGGLGIGGGLGLLGIAITRWDNSAGLLYFTPNRWLVLGITLVVSVRVLYGLWRTWEAVRVSLETMTLAAASGLATSMSAGAVVLGYYFVFWAGVERRIGQHRRARRRAGF